MKVFIESDSLQSLWENVSCIFVGSGNSLIFGSTVPISVLSSNGLFHFIGVFLFFIFRMAVFIEFKAYADNPG